MRFGRSTDSGDRDGNTIEEKSPEEIKTFYTENISRIQEEILKIKDTTSQIPPVISALKVGGMRQSSLYRGGIEFESVSRQMQIYQFAYQNLTESGFEMSLRVSSGTYIRKIVMDLGEVLGFPMYMESLIRMSIGKISLEQALSADEILFPDCKFSKLEDLIKFPWVDLNEVQTKSVRHGGYIDPNGIEGNFLLRDNNGSLLAWCSTLDKKAHLPYKYLKVFYNPDEN